MGIPIVFFSRNNLPRKKESGEERLVYICYERGKPIDLVLAELGTLLIVNFPSTLVVVAIAVPFTSTVAPTTG